MFLCTPSGMHPYNCTWDKYCEHCTLARTEWHTPEKCGLCDWLRDDHPDKGKLRKLVDEPFAIRVRVRDYSHRYQKVKVKNWPPQQTLPF